MRYLLSLRMQCAKALLRDERNTLTAIATQVGYRSDAGFATAFKREVGRSPGGHRRDRFQATRTAPESDADDGTVT